LPLARLGG